MADLAVVRTRVARRYRAETRFDRTYVAMKLRHDPIYRELLGYAERERLGQVVDIGCGCGQGGLFLLEAGCAASVTGLDWNADHLRQARKAADGLAFQALQQDLATDQTVPDADAILIIDVLYQLDTGAQMRLLHAAARAARTHILIRTVNA